MHTDSSRTGLRRSTAASIVLVVGATLAVALDAPAWLATTLSALTALVVTDRLVARRQRGWADAVAFGAAGLLVVLSLLGLLLDVLPGGLDRVSWAVGAGLLALLALGRSAPRGGRSRRHPTDRRAVTRLAPAYLGAVVLAAVALIVAVHATRVANRPDEALSITGRSPGHRVTVEVSAGHARGRYELVVAGRTGVAQTVLGPFDVGADGQVTRAVRIPDPHHSVISLRKPGSSRALRTLIVSEDGAS